jgi:hypothetical protein
MTRSHPHWSRRVVLQRGLTLGGALVAAGHGGRAFAQFVGENEPFIPTPGQILGPAHPVEKPADQDADLTMIKGPPGHAEGHVIRVAGKVSTGESLFGAQTSLAN